MLMIIRFCTIKWHLILWNYFTWKIVFFFPFFSLDGMFFLICKFPTGCEMSVPRTCFLAFTSEEKKYHELFTIFFFVFIIILILFIFSYFGIFLIHHGIRIRRNVIKYDWAIRKKLINVTNFFVLNQLLVSNNWYLFRPNVTHLEPAIFFFFFF